MLHMCCFVIIHIIQGVNMCGVHSIASVCHFLCVREVIMLAGKCEQKSCLFQEQTARKSCSFYCHCYSVSFVLL